MTTGIEGRAGGPQARRRSGRILGARALLPILIMLVSGCAPRAPKPPPVVPGAQGGEIMQRFLGEAPCPRALASDVELEIRPPERPAVRLVGGLRVSWPDRVRLQLRFGPFTPVASIAIRGDSAFVSLPKIKAYWSGRPAAEEEASPAVLASGLLWLICPLSLVRSIEDPVLDRDGKGWVLRGRLRDWNPGLLASLRLSKEGGDIGEIVLADSNGMVLLRCERSGRIRIGRVSIPERVRVETGTHPIAFTVRFMRAREDGGQSPDRFRIPPPAGARHLQSRELLDLIYAGGTHS